MSEPVSDSGSIGPDPDLPRTHTRRSTIHVQTNDGWQELKGVTIGPIRAVPTSSPEPVLTTLREFSGSLTFTMTKRDRRRSGRLIQQWIDRDRQRRSAMHRAYRAKTRRRNRRRK